MDNPTTETRTFVGESATAVTDGWAGFRLGQRYELHVTKGADRTVSIMLDKHEYAAFDIGLVITEEQYEKWFTK